MLRVVLYMPGWKSRGFVCESYRLCSFFMLFFFLFEFVVFMCSVTAAMDEAVDTAYHPVSGFVEDKREPLIDLELTDSTELWLFQWPINQVMFLFFMCILSNSWIRLFPIWCVELFSFRYLVQFYLVYIKFENFVDVSSPFILVQSELLPMLSLNIAFGVNCEVIYC